MKIRGTRRHTFAGASSAHAGTRACCRSLVDREPIEAELVADGAIIELHGNPPSGTISHGVGIAGLAEVVAIGVPALGQVQLTVKQAVEVLACKAQMDGDDAVLGLTQPTVPLLLHARCLVALFRVAGLVDDPDSVARPVLSGDKLLEPVAPGSPLANGDG